MSDAIITAAITGGLAVLSNLLISWQNGSKTLYRIEQLEKKVEKHNDLVERVAIIERDEKTQWKQIDEIKAKLERM